jgi:tetratricopeptide (TPR) repeat protein
LLILSLSCDQKPITPEKIEPSLKLRVEFAGCQAVRRGPICVLPDDRKIKLWIKSHRLAKITLKSDGEILRSQPKFIQSGYLHKVQLPESSKTINVIARHGSLQKKWSLSFGPPIILPWYDHLVALWDAGKFEELNTFIEKRLAEPTSEIYRGLCLSWLGNTLLRQGDVRSAMGALRDAVSMHANNGLMSDMAKEACTLVHLLVINQRRFVDARRALDSVSVPGIASAESSFNILYTKATLAFGIGDLRTAVELYRAAYLTTERLEMFNFRMFAGQMLALQLQMLGRRKEALALFDELWRKIPKDSNACGRAHLLNNRGWAQALEVEAGERHDSDATKYFQDALSLFEEKCSADLNGRISALINLSIAQLLSGRVSEAKRCLAEYKKIRPHPDMRDILWEFDVPARIALADGRVKKALELYRKLEDTARVGYAPDAVWRATLGMGKAYWLLGQRKKALAAFAEAEKLVGQAALNIGLSEGRETFIAQKRRGTQLYIQSLLAENEEETAFWVARSARIRALQSLWQAEQQRKLSPAQREKWDVLMGEYGRRRDALVKAAGQDWKLSAEQLRMVRAERKLAVARINHLLDEALQVRQSSAIHSDRQKQRWVDPVPGELVLLFFPLKNGWVGFAADAHGVVVKRIARVDLEDSETGLSKSLLEPFSAQIDPCKTIRILPYDELNRLDFHALPWKGEPLMALKVVLYGLDMPLSGNKRKQQNAGLVLVDPQEDLPQAKREKELVSQGLKRCSASMDLNPENSFVNASALRNKLERSDVFHFAGHAELGSSEGWGNALQLAAGREYGVGDVIACQQVPTWVVLLGCNTGNTAQNRMAGFGLAQAFAAAGSQFVIASSRNLDDSLAAEFTRLLYSGSCWLTDAKSSFQKAQLALRNRFPEKDWASLRMIVP